MPNLNLSIDTDRKVFKGLIATLGISMLMPEYIAPIFIFVLYIFFIKHFKKTDRNAKLGNVGKVFLLYMGYMLISSLWSKTHTFSALIALLWMGCFLGYILIANLVNTEDKLKTAITAVNISAGIIGVIAILEFASFNMTRYISWFHFLFPNPLYYEINDFVFDLIPVDIINYRFRSRASATFDNPLILAMYLVITTPFCAFGSVFFNKSKSRKLSRACLIFAFGGIISTSSRSAYIAIGIALIIMLLSNKKLLKKLLPVVAVLAVALPIGLLYRFKNLSLQDFLASDSQRIGIWKSCLDMFTHSPVFGLGAGTDNIHTLLVEEYGIARPHAHNLFLQMLVEGGIIGFSFVIAIIVLLIKNLHTIYKNKDGEYKPYAVLYTASLAGFTISSMTEFTLQSAKELMIFFFLLGFTEATRRLVTKEVQLPNEIIYEEENEEKETVEV